MEADCEHLFDFLCFRGIISAQSGHTRSNPESGLQGTDSPPGLFLTGTQVRSYGELFRLFKLFRREKLIFESPFKDHNAKDKNTTYPTPL